jgi:hypothetical protein
MAVEPGPDFEALLDQLAEAKAALLAAEAEATTELIHAKAAYREKPTGENRARKAKAVEVIQALRAAVRRDREGTRVGGDAFVTPAEDLPRDETEGLVG